MNDDRRKELKKIQKTMGETADKFKALKEFTQKLEDLR
jgi:hypothetical protein